MVWVRDRMEVTRASADFYGGTADFTYLMAPLGKRDQPARAVFDVKYRDVDLTALTGFYETPGLRLAGRASDNARAREALVELGLNPLMTEAFRDRGQPT